MKNKVYSFKNGSDSAIMYHTKLPKYLAIILAVILLLVSGTIVWSVFTKKSEVVKIQGTFEVDDRTEIMPSVSSTIKKVYVENGKVVSVGDKLFELDDIDVAARISQYEEVINNLTYRKQMYETLFLL